MLIRLLRSHLRPYRGVLIAVAVLQFAQSIATLYLPSLNAKIIDNGVATGDNAFIWRTGALMLVITLVQVCFAIGAVYFGSRASMGFGRDVRSGLFHRVTDFSTQEVESLRRAVADHPHHERRATGADARADDLHAAGRGADHRHRRHGLGDAGGRRACPSILARRDPAPAGHRGLDRLADGAAVPPDARADRRGQPGAPRADHRHPGRAGVRARARRVRSGSTRRTPTSPRPRCARRGSWP